MPSHERIPAWVYEAERAYEEAFAHLGVTSPELQAAFAERVKEIRETCHMGPLSAIRWAESEWATNPPRGLRKASPIVTIGPRDGA